MKTKRHQIITSLVCVIISSGIGWADLPHELATNCPPAWSFTCRELCDVFSSDGSTLTVKASSDASYEVYCASNDLFVLHHLAETWPQRAMESQRNLAMLVRNGEAMLVDMDTHRPHPKPRDQGSIFALGGLYDKIQVPLHPDLYEAGLLDLYNKCHHSPVIAELESPGMKWRKQRPVVEVNEFLGGRVYRAYALDGSDQDKPTLNQFFAYLYQRESSFEQMDELWVPERGGIVPAPPAEDVITEALAHEGLLAGEDSFMKPSFQYTNGGYTLKSDLLDEEQAASVHAALAGLGLENPHPQVKSVAARKTEDGELVVEFLVQSAGAPTTRMRRTIINYSEDAAAIRKKIAEFKIPDVAEASQAPERAAMDDSRATPPPESAAEGP